MIYLIIYFSVVLYIIIVNFYRIRRCKSIPKKLKKYSKNSTRYKNINYMPEINTLLLRANMKIQLNELEITNSSYIHPVELQLLVAKARFISRIKRSLLWGYDLLLTFTIFSKINSLKTNWIMKLILVIAEWFFLYLITCLFDSYNFGDKILSFLFSALFPQLQYPNH